MKRRTLLIALLALVALPLGVVFAQRIRNRAPVNVSADRRGIPSWENDQRFPDDMFTFVRIRYKSWRGGAWATDYPDSDLNFSYRLQQLTSIRTHPEGKIMELTDPALFDHPFIYIIEPGGIQLDEDEVAALRKYLLAGGFLMVDDFWGESEWEVFHEQFKRVFPDRDLVELPLDHPIFHCVYDLKKKYQVPSIGMAHAGREYGITWEREDAREVHYKGLFDDKGRMLAIVCHNTDLGDGWEREGEDEWYFREFSEKKAYPMGINIIFYAMTH